jgi:hypothetical protein
MNALIMSILLAHSAPTAIPPEALGAEIVRYSAIYDVNPVMVASILMLESKGRADVISSTHDYGLMQINNTYAKNAKISMTCLKDWKCNLITGIKLLSEYKKLSHFRPCMYNVGPKRYNSKQCLIYESKLAKLIPTGGLK